jgi:hypothetical protein
MKKRRCKAISCIDLGRRCVDGSASVGRENLATIVCPVEDAVDDAYLYTRTQRSTEP